MWFAALFLAAPPPIIHGASPKERAFLDRTLARVPPDWLSCSPKAVEIEVVDRIGNDLLNAQDEYIPREDFAEGRARLRVTHLDLAPDSPAFRAESARNARAYCADPERVLAFDQDLEGTLVHELAHNLQFNNGCVAGVAWEGKPLTYGDLVNRFLAIRFFALYRAVHMDVRWWAIQHEIRSIKARKIDPQAKAELLCQVKADRDALFREYRIVQRIPGDVHAMGAEDGAEYFAMAVETLVRMPEIFCASFSPEEQAWLKENLGDRLAGMSRLAPCYRQLEVGSQQPADRSQGMVAP